MTHRPPFSQLTDRITFTQVFHTGKACLGHSRLSTALSSKEHQLVSERMVPLTLLFPVGHLDPSVAHSAALRRGWEGKGRRLRKRESPSILVLERIMRLTPVQRIKQSSGTIRGWGKRIGSQKIRPRQVPRRACHAEEALSWSGPITDPQRGGHRESSCDPHSH